MYQVVTVAEASHKAIGHVYRSITEHDLFPGYDSHLTLHLVTLHYLPLDFKFYKQNSLYSFEQKTCMIILLNVDYLSNGIITTIKLRGAHQGFLANLS